MKLEDTVIGRSLGCRLRTRSACWKETKRVRPAGSASPSSAVLCLTREAAFSVWPSCFGSFISCALYPLHKNKHFLKCRYVPQFPGKSWKNFKYFKLRFDKCACAMIKYIWRGSVPCIYFSFCGKWILSLPLRSHPHCCSVWLVSCIFKNVTQ